MLVLDTVLLILVLFVTFLTILFIVNLLTNLSEVIQPSGFTITFCRKWKPLVLLLWADFHLLPIFFTFGCIKFMRILTRFFSLLPFLYLCLFLPRSTSDFHLKSCQWWWVTGRFSSNLHDSHWAQLSIPACFGAEVGWHHRWDPEGVLRKSMKWTCWILEVNVS